MICGCDYGGGGCVGGVGLWGGVDGVMGVDV